MRKAVAILFALAITVSASAAPNVDSPRNLDPISRIIRIIKRLLPIHAFDDIQPGTGIPH